MSRLVQTTVLVMLAVGVTIGGTTALLFDVRFGIALGLALALVSGLQIAWIVRREAKDAAQHR